METKYKTIPFDVNRINEEGVQVVTRNGRSARILCTDLKDRKPIVAVVTLIDGEGEDVLLYNADGTMCEGVESEADLMLQVPIIATKYRRMTNQELSWWLRDCPEEHREWKFDGYNTVYCNFTYLEDYANYECDNYILIRRNGGEWKEPLIEE